MSQQVSELYKECDHIKRTQPDMEVDPSLLKQLSTGFKLLPSFEKTFFDAKYTKHYSLERNEFLKCRWKVYRDHITEKVFAPFQFPDISHLHFHNGSIRFMPQLSLSGKNHKMKMRSGPGVDNIGQLPITAVLKPRVPGAEKTVSKNKKSSKKAKGTENKKEKGKESDTNKQSSKNSHAETSK